MTKRSISGRKFRTKLLHQFDPWPFPNDTNGFAATTGKDGLTTTILKTTDGQFLSTLNSGRTLTPWNEVGLNR
jgi:hypothetical protein